MQTKGAGEIIRSGSARRFDLSAHTDTGRPDRSIRLVDELVARRTPNRDPEPSLCRGWAEWRLGPRHDT